MIYLCVLFVFHLNLCLSSHPAALSVVGGHPITVPIIFRTGGANVTGMLFSIDFDQRCFFLDETDSDGDQIPEAITFNVTPQHSPSVIYSRDDEDGELDFVIADYRPPLASLPAESTIVSIRFLATCQSAPGAILTAPVQFSTVPEASFGDDAGGDVVGHVEGGVVQILSNIASPISTAILGATSTPASTPLATLTPPDQINNLPPLANDDEISLHEDGSTLIDPLANDSDPNGDSLSLLGIGRGLHGTTAFTANNQIVYRPDLNYYGLDSFFYQMTDGQGGQAEATVTVRIHAINDPPIIEPPEAQHHRAGDEVTLDLLVHDPDDEQDSLSISATGLPYELRVDQARQQVRGVVGIDVAGIYTVVVTTSDGEYDAQASFIWTIECVICPSSSTKSTFFLPLVMGGVKSE